MAEERGGATRRWWWLIVVGLVIGAGAGNVLGQASETNVSTAQVLVNPAGGIEIDIAYTGNQYVSARMPTYAALASTDSVTDRATEALGIEPGSLVGAVTATVGTVDATVIDLAVTGPSPQEAQGRATAVVDALQAVLLETENPPAQPPRVNLNVISPASLPDAAPLGATTVMIIGAVVGLLGGAVAFSVLSRRDRAAQRRRDTYDAGLSARGQADGRGSATNGRAAPPPVSPRRPAPTGDGYPGRERS